MKTTNEIYNQTIQVLKTNARALPKYSDDLIQKIKFEFDNIDWENLSTDEILDSLKKFYCILTNTQTSNIHFQEILLKSKKYLFENKNDDLIILFLAAINKQFIDYSLKSGNLIPQSIIDILKSLLENKNPEILEWTLRSIETMGAQGLKLEKEIKKLRPSIFKIFNKHQQTAFELVNHIEQEWMRYKNERR